MKLLTATFALALPLAATFAAASDASACGITPQFEARVAVDLHFRALNAHDEKQLAAMWMKDGFVIDRRVPMSGRAPRVSTSSLQSAAKVWFTDGEIKHKIDRISMDGPVARAHATVTYAGSAERDEDFVLVRTADGFKILTDTTSELSY